MDELLPIFITGIVFFSFVAIVKIISDNRLRNRLVEKGIVDENVKYLFHRNGVIQPMTSLKWGLLLLGVGLALLLTQLMPRTFYEEGALGLIFILAGLALFVHYFIAKRIQKKESNVQG